MEKEQGAHKLVAACASLHQEIVDHFKTDERRREKFAQKLRKSRYRLYLAKQNVANSAPVRSKGRGSRGGQHGKVAPTRGDAFIDFYSQRSARRQRDNSTRNWMRAEDEPLGKPPARQPMPPSAPAPTRPSAPKPSTSTRRGRSHHATTEATKAWAAPAPKNAVLPPPLEQIGYFAEELRPKSPRGRPSSQRPIQLVASTADSDADAASTGSARARVARKVRRSAQRGGMRTPRTAAGSVLPLDEMTFGRTARHTATTPTKAATPTSYSASTSTSTPSTKTKTAHYARARRADSMRCPSSTRDDEARATNVPFTARKGRPHSAREPANADAARQPLHRPRTAGASWFAGTWHTAAPSAGQAERSLRTLQPATANIQPPTGPDNKAALMWQRPATMPRTMPRYGGGGEHTIRPKVHELYSENASSSVARTCIASTVTSRTWQLLADIESQTPSE